MMVRSGAPVLYPRMTFQISDVSGLWFYLDLAKYKCLWFMIVYDCLCISRKKSNSDGFKEFACRLWSPGPPGTAGSFPMISSTSRWSNLQFFGLLSQLSPTVCCFTSIYFRFCLLQSLQYFNHHLWLTWSLWSQCSAAQTHHFFSICL